MVPEPVTITFVALRTVGVVGQAITSCIGIYKGWKLTQKFGDDYSVTWRNFQIQCARLEQISRRKLDFLKSKLDPYNAGDPTTNAVLKQLSVLEFHFSKCIKLMAKYEKPKTEPQEKATTTDRDTDLDTTNITAGADKELPNASDTEEMIEDSMHSVTTRDDPQGSRTEGQNNREEKKKKKKNKISLRPQSWIFGRKVEKSNEQGKGKGKAVLDLPPSTIVQIPASETTELSLPHSRPSSSQVAEEMTTAITTTSAYTSQIAQDEIRARREDAASWQKNTGFLRRAWNWARTDRDAFIKHVADIKTCVDNLESLLTEEMPKDPLRILPTHNDIAQADQEVYKVQKSMQRLHYALASRTPPKSLQISVQVMMDLKKQAQILARQEDYLAFRSDALVFVLQAHSKTLNTPALRLVAEVAENTDGQLSLDYRMRDIENMSATVKNVVKEFRLQDERKKEFESGKKAEDIIDNQESSEEEDESDEKEWDTLGTLCHKGTPSDIHRLFYNRKSKYQTDESLRDILDTEEFRKFVRLPLRVGLGILTTTALLYHADTRKLSSNSIIQPINFRYYRKLEDKAVQPKLSYVLTPYLSIGVGEKPQKVVIGEESGILGKKTSLVVELGLLLFQIVTCTHVDYGQGIEGVQKAKEVALQNLHMIDLKAGAVLAELIEFCLSSKTQNLHTGANEDEFPLVQRIIALLTHFKDKLEGD